MSKIKPTILAVDDDEDILNTFSIVLKKDFNVVTKDSGKKAIERILENNIDLVLLDINMPVLNGLQVLQQIKDIDSSLDVIMVSAIKDLPQAIKAMKLGAYDYISKPFEVDELLATIKKAMEKRALVKENFYLKATMKQSSGDMHGKSQAMQSLYKVIETIAPNNSTILIEGESGTGKELVARQIHKKSSRSDKPFIAINCAAIPEHLFESELFGYEKGAFTSANEKKIGKFELANEGTIFLDEIGCLPLTMQSKLLRVLQENEVERLGGHKPIPIDVRVISATNINIKEEIKNGTFREDLYYRLNIIPIKLPALREREGDVELLLKEFLQIFNAKFHKNIKGFDKKTLSILTKYKWPGNIRELKNLMERFVALCHQDLISFESLPLDVLGDNLSLVLDEPIAPEIIVAQKRKKLLEMFPGTIKEVLETFERNYLQAMLDECEGNRTKTAKKLGIHRTTMITKINQLGLK